MKEHEQELNNSDNPILYYTDEEEVMNFAVVYWW